MERKLKCIVIDDEPLARGLIESYVTKTPSLALNGLYESASDAFVHITADAPDLTSLDIDMPMLNGIEFAALVPRSTRIIFVTAYGQYALEGFRVNALDYLLKPVSYAEFMRGVGKAAEWFGLSERRESAPVQRGMLTVKADYRLVQMRMEDIRYIEVRRYNGLFFRMEGEPVKSGMSMRKLEAQLPSDTFMRVHRFFIVNLHRVEVVERGRIVFGKTYIPISDTRRDEFLARFGRI